MDLSFGLSGPQQWALLVGVLVVLTALISLWIRLAHNWYTTKLNWTAQLEELKHRNTSELDLNKTIR